MAGGGADEEQGDDEPALPAGSEHHGRAEELGGDRDGERARSEACIEHRLELRLSEGEGVGRPDPEQAQSQSAGDIPGRGRQAADDAPHGRDGGREDPRADSPEQTDHRGDCQVAGREWAEVVEGPDGPDAETAQPEVDAVAAEGADDRRDERLVVLQAASMEDLQGEERGAQRGSEQHREARGHAGDRQDACVEHRPLQSSGDDRADGAGGLHERRLGSHGRPGGDAQQRRGDQRPQPPDTLRATDDVDVVDEQLDVAGLAAEPGDERDRGPDGHQDGELRGRRVVLRPEDGGQEVEQADVRRADESTEHADEHRGRAESAPEPDRGRAEQVAEGEWAHRKIVARHVVARQSEPPRDGRFDLRGPLGTSRYMIYY